MKKSILFATIGVLLAGIQGSMARHLIEETAPHISAETGFHELHSPSAMMADHPIIHEDHATMFHPESIPQNIDPNKDVGSGCEWNPNRGC